MRKITFYKKNHEKAPVEVFLDGINAKQAQKMIWVMRLVEDFSRVPKQYLKKLTSTDDIWEIRAQMGSDIFRVLGFFVNDNHFIATNGFQKKTNTIPKADIHIAEARKKDYLTQQKRGKS